MQPAAHSAWGRHVQIVRIDVPPRSSRRKRLRGAARSKSRLSWLNDERRQKIEPPMSRHGGPPQGDDRPILGGIVPVPGCGRRCYDRPAEYAPYPTVKDCFDHRA
ncbi:MAG: hypothetical protein J0J10_23375 [Bosea sp.]|uniref:hypothetical protein n=1 Tax=Bosea sp. (in: a-proteobacteria) TaxID=1871050 RepID=UPI001AC31838|nr:hypothetical protein [Bosea sp. (in: a-proteobacteria)]MBN9471715.1 hypothetical protein [Bosea sp. (in: a-proteobacteria)]